MEKIIEILKSGGTIFTQQTPFGELAVMPPI
jgi:hypothetical protein